MTAPAAPRRWNLSGRIGADRAALAAVDLLRLASRPSAAAPCKPIRGRHVKFVVGLADREDGLAGEAPLRECGDRVVQSGPARDQAEDGVEAAGGDQPGQGCEIRAGRL